MASSIINSDDGVISGTSGLKSTGGDDGVLVFQSKGTETARFNTDKQIVAAAGTASLPVLTTTGDLNTGIYFPAADNIGITTGGTARLNVDGSGRVTTPTQPFFLAVRSGDQTGYDANSLLDVVVIYNSATTNIGSHYNTSTGKFTAPVAGVYVFYAAAYAAVQSFSQSWLVINGSRANYTDWAGSSSEFQQGFWMVNLAANDTVGYHPYAGGASNVTITASTHHTYFYGHLLG